MGYQIISFRSLEKVCSYYCVQLFYFESYFVSATVYFWVFVFVVVTASRVGWFRRCNNLSKGWKATESSFCSLCE